MTVAQILTLIGVPSLISGVFLVIVNRNLKRQDTKREVLEKQNAELEKQNKAIMLGVQALLRDRLLQGYKHYSVKGWAAYDDRDNLENIYQQYHSLGQNGVMDDMREKFLALPLYQKEGVSHEKEGVSHEDGEVRSRPDF